MARSLVETLSLLTDGFKYLIANVHMKV